LNGRIAARILNLGVRWRWMVRFTTRPLYLRGKGPRYLSSKRLGGHQNRSGRCGVERNS